MTTATVQPVDTVLTTEIVDNTSGLITPAMARNGWESSAGIPVSPNGVQTASYTAAITDRGCILPMNVGSGSANYTIPPHSSVAFPVNCMLGMVWLNGAAIQPAFVAGAGVTIITPSTLTARAVGSTVWAWQYIQDTWYITGDIS